MLRRDFFLRLLSFVGLGWLVLRAEEDTPQTPAKVCQACGTTDHTRRIQQVVDVGASFIDLRSGLSGVIIMYCDDSRRAVLLTECGLYLNRSYEELLPPLHDVG